MKITALAPWFGAKRTLAPRIVEALGPHSCYWEPFCGSMAVLLAKPLASMETVNDLHGDLVNLARAIRDPIVGPALYRRLRRTLASKDLMDESAAAVKSHDRAPAPIEPDLDRAYHYFLTSWLGRNGVAGTESYNQGFSRRFTENGGHAATRWTNAVSTIPAWRRRMRCVSILNEDGFSILDRIEDAPGTAIYCDPPYLKKGAKYVHDFEVRDHRRLAESLRRFRRARVVVSYYDHPRLVELYPDWDRQHIEVTKALVSQGRRGHTGAARATEVLLINQPPTRQGTLFGDDS